MIMAINYYHQLTLLKDILANQLTEDYGSHDEFHQLQSLVQSLVQNNATPEDLKQTLLSIEQYAYQHDKEGAHSHLGKVDLDSWIQQVNHESEKFH